MKLEERFLNGADEIRRLAMKTLFERSSALSIFPAARASPGRSTIAKCRQQSLR
jgi:hypothetical protein